MAAKEGVPVDLAFAPQEESDSDEEVTALHSRGKSAPSHPLEDLILESGKEIAPMCMTVSP